MLVYHRKSIGIWDNLIQPWVLVLSNELLNDGVKGMRSLYSDSLIDLLDFLNGSTVWLWK